jgi:uroporphyrinogen decarboxylase
VSPGAVGGSGAGADAGPGVGMGLGTGVGIGVGTGAATPDLVRACLQQPVVRTPVWFMRQAGRSLPEYRAARGEGSILSAIADASLAAELTLQPVRRYGVDAAILFSDIVVPLHAIGFGVEVEAGRGPVVAQPFAGGADLERVRAFAPEEDAPYVAEAARLVASELAGSGVALIGFAGAPFTVASYMVEGGPSRTFARVKALMHGEPALWERLCERLAEMAVASLRAQIEAGAQAVQLFDSWAGSLSPDEYARFALPAVRSVMDGVADLGVPTILFGVGTGELLGLMGTSGASVVGVDWRVPLDEARRRVGAGAALQGNLDPALCLAPWEVVEAAALDVIRRAAPKRHMGHVFNLGHGVLPETDPGILAAVVDLVHETTTNRGFSPGDGVAG